MSEKKTEQSPNSKVSEISNQTKKPSVIEPDKKGNSANQEGVSSTSSNGVINTYIGCSKQWKYH